MIPKIDKELIKPKNQIEIVLNIKYINLKTPKKPIFKTILANNALISVFTSTCTSGSHICSGHIGYFIANIINNNNQIKIIKCKLSNNKISIKFNKFIELKWNNSIIEITIQKIELIELKIIK